MNFGGVEHEVEHRNGRALPWVDVSCGYRHCTWSSTHVDNADGNAAVEAELKAHLADEHNVDPS